MIDGIYTITFRGATDWGVGMLILQEGVVTGADAAGVLYDGTFVQENSSVGITLTMTVPPGATLVQGTPAQSKSYTIPVNVSLPVSALDSNEAITLDMPPGPVNVIFRRLRSLSS